MLGLVLYLIIVPSAMIFHNHVQSTDGASIASEAGELIWNILLIDAIPPTVMHGTQLVLFSGTEIAINHRRVEILCHHHHDSAPSLSSLQTGWP